MDQNRLYYQDAYVRQGSAVVRSCEPCKKGFAVTLDQTIFYPTGGGQPCDLGVIGEAKVLDVSQVQVSRIEKKAIAQLRELME